MKVARPAGIFPGPFEDVAMKREPRLIIPPPPRILVIALLALFSAYALAQFLERLASP
jgi:hypothetical protein